MNILLVDDENSVRISLSEFLTKIGHKVICASSAFEALSFFHENEFDVVITDIKMPDMDGLELLKKIKIIERSTVDVIVITGHGDVNNAVKALQYGAYDYFLKPLKIKELAIILERCSENRKFQIIHKELQTKLQEKISSETLNCRAELERLREAYIKEKGLDNIFVHSEAMRYVLNLAEKFSSDRRIPVLIQGESGTGKEMIAHYIHFFGEGKNVTPFIALNCAAIPDNLFESELFGYESGAYTGAAVGGKKGKIEAAQYGSLFLDEIADMPMNLQIKLLRVIEDQKFYKLGDAKEMSVDVRYIFSTNKNLIREIKDDNFRLDLYYRINLATILIPPLRDRRDDIMPLSIRFLSDAMIRRGKKYQGFSKKAQDILMNYSWPGNVRQLKNVMERISFSDIFGIIKREDLRPLLDNELIAEKSLNQESSLKLLNFDINELPDDGINLENLLNDIIIKSLMKNDGNKTKTARYLGMSRRALHYRLNKIHQ